MAISEKEITRAIFNNDTNRVVEILEEFELYKNNLICPHTVHKELVSSILRAASAMAHTGNLKKGLAVELIERTSIMVNVFSFLELVAISAKVKTEYYDEEDYQDVPEKILETLLWDRQYSDEIANAIEKLEIEAFEALIAFLVNGEVDAINVEFGLPIIKYVYKNGIVPNELVFAFMALCQRQTIEEYLSGRVVSDIGDILEETGMEM